VTPASEPVRIADAAWLTDGPLGKLITVLDRDGEEARVVGGAVRNVLIGQPIDEIDVATTALPPEVVRRAEAAGFKAVPTGIEHGTVTVVVDHRPFEVTTLREDVETFGRHAVVRFGRDWRADAARRDFTINALSLSRDGIVHDYVGGLADIAVRRVRFIGQASARIAEDYLRVLRFFRFHAAYGVGLPDPEGLQACIDARENLDRLSRERVRMELMKLLVAVHAVRPDADHVALDAHVQRARVHAGQVAVHHVVISAPVGVGGNHTCDGWHSSSTPVWPVTLIEQVTAKR